MLAGEIEWLSWEDGSGSFFLYAASAACVVDYYKKKKCD